MPDPFKMLEEMPQAVFQYWLAYKRLQDLDIRQQAEWDALSEQEFIEHQSNALRDMFGGAKTEASKRNKH